RDGRGAPTTRYRYLFSRDTSSTAVYDSDNPNAIETLLFTDPAGFDAFFTGDRWTTGGNVTFGADTLGRNIVKLHGSNPNYTWVRKDVDDGNRFATVDFLPTHATPSSAPYLLRYDGAGSLHTCSMRFWNNHIAATTKINGTGTWHWDWNDEPIEIGTWYTLELEITETETCIYRYYPSGRPDEGPEPIVATGMPEDWAERVLLLTYDDPEYFASFYE